MYVAARDIPKGSEVLTAYGPEYWRGIEASAAFRAGAALRANAALRAGNAAPAPAGPCA